MTCRLYQHSTLGALMAGCFEGTMTIEDLLKQGDTGIGTVHGLDGELIVLKGRAYQVGVNGAVQQLDGKERTPYAAVTFFETENTVEITEETSMERLTKRLQDRFSSLNTFQAVRISGTFAKVQCRSVAKQEPPYPKLVEVTQSQTEFTRGPVEGTLIGFYAPELFSGMAAPGFHWHFLSRGVDFGGHVLDFILEDGTAEWQTIETVEQHFPVENDAFLHAEIESEYLNEKIEEAEN